MNTSLRAAIEDSYAAFAGYATGKTVDFAAEPSVGSDENAHMRAVLKRSPVRSLDTCLVLKYLEYVDAACYDGRYDENEFRHFLPRILEMVTDGGYAGTWGRECLERCLERAGVRDRWPSSEIQAIDRVLALGHENGVD